MPMSDNQAAIIAIACVNKVGGHSNVAMGDQLGSDGVGSQGLLDNLIDKICNDMSIGVPSVGFLIKASEFTSIKTTSTVTDVSNVISNKAIQKG